MDKIPYEITTYRIDGKYEDNRHPSEVTYAKTIEEDLSRRDFTINAMAYDPINKILKDPFNGMKDIENKVIRCVGDPNKRFNEDGLRILRAIRFACQKEFTISEEVLFEICTNADLIKNISVERIKSELDKIVISNKAEYGFIVLKLSDLLEKIMPEYVLTEEIAEALEKSDGNLITRYSVLFNNNVETAKSVMSYLKFDNATRDRVLKTISALSFEVTDKISLKKLLQKVENFFDWIETKKALSQIKDEDFYGDMFSEIYKYNEPYLLKHLAVDGIDVMETLNISPSKQVKEKLDDLLETVIVHPELNTKDDLICLLRSWI
jgi:tRNA nucleotidyltransferase (CCA-adding enzyme)